MKSLTLILLFGVFAVVAGIVHAEEQESPESREMPDSPDVFATVNGTPLSLNLYHFLKGSREGDSMERQAYDDGFDAELHDQQTAKDLVMTEVLAQQASQAGMDESELVKVEMEMAEKTLLAQLYVKKLMDDIEVAESDIRRHYEQQREQAMYRFMIWRTRDEDRAMETLKAVKAGKDAGLSDENVIETPWLRDTDIEADVNEIVSQLKVNEFADQPVFQDGFWKVVQVIDKQVMEKESYNEEREVIRAELVRVKLDEKLEKLARDASVVFNEKHVRQPAN